jgi:hypothetical protein
MEGQVGFSGVRPTRVGQCGAIHSGAFHLADEMIPVPFPFCSTIRSLLLLRRHSLYNNVVSTFYRASASVGESERRLRHHTSADLPTLTLFVIMLLSRSCFFSLTLFVLPYELWPVCVHKISRMSFSPRCSRTPPRVPGLVIACRLSHPLASSILFTCIPVSGHVGRVYPRLGVRAATQAGTHATAASVPLRILQVDPYVELPARKKVGDLGAVVGHLCSLCERPIHSRSSGSMCGQR